MEMDATTMTRMMTERLMPKSTRRRVTNICKIMECLNIDGRMSLRQISQRTGISISYVHDLMKVIRSHVRFRPEIMSAGRKEVSA